MLFDGQAERKIIDSSERMAKEKSNKAHLKELNAKNKQSMAILATKRAALHVSQLQRKVVLQYKLQAEQLAAAARRATAKAEQRAHAERHHKFIVEARHVRWQELVALSLIHI
eukprot:TRINITY_DN8815_c0_g1_i2.p3 TRINITY_DN8815_c0_g1~~TRINITY_DN8815_c0_g1_i2.p3  ORF type:complete len:113 (-),score=51.02 TRINITY_DN8815_c0_g1_i2:74-412(-)